MGYSINVDNTNKPPTVLSLCTGYGGLEIGIEKAIGKIKTLAHVEIEAFAIANLVNKMETGKLDPVPIFTNIKTFRPYIFRDKVDILTGGYPCQPFSIAGKQKGADDPRHLWPWIRETIKAVRPGLCFFENVEQHINIGLREVLTDLVKLGYSVENDCGEPTWGLFSAAEVGAPHQRKRVFILAYSKRSIDRAKEWYKTDRPHSERSTSRNSRSSKLLANSGSSKPNRISESEEWKQNREVGNTGIELVDSESANDRLPVGTCAEKSLPEFSGYQWPARPGQNQYEWEEPRTLADTQLSGAPSNRSHVRMGREKEQSTQGPRGTQIKTKPQLGRTIDGNRDRVDRLRLSGNGVVPDEGAKAFITLMNRILYPQQNKAPAIQLEIF